MLYHFPLIWDCSSFPQSFFVFHDLDAFEDSRSVIYKMPPLPVWAYAVFSHDGSGVMHFWQEYHRNYMPYSVYCIRKCLKSIYLNVDWLIWYWPVFFAVKLYFFFVFFFVINKSHVRRYFNTIQISSFSSYSYPLILAFIDGSWLPQLLWSLSNGKLLFFYSSYICSLELSCKQRAISCSAFM